MVQSYQTSTGKADIHGSLSEQSQSWHRRAQHGGNLLSTTSLQQEEAQDFLLHTQTRGHTEPTAVSTGSCMVSVATVCAHRWTQGTSQSRAVGSYEVRNRHLQTLPWRAAQAQPGLQDLGANPWSVASAKLCCRDPDCTTSNPEPRASLTDLSRTFTSVYSAQS